MAIKSSLPPHLIPHQSRISSPIDPHGIKAQISPAFFCTHLKPSSRMDWGLLGNPNFTTTTLPPPPPINPPAKISPSVFLIIVILAIVFFISGLLHLLARCLLRPTTAVPEDPGSATALQGQLQQLFQLHDAGVDQTFIDSLPLFLYKAIIGVKDPFDCAVCLCEFEPDDKLRLLPKCSHAFHLDCIDTWLLSHSTCPLCRRSLLTEISPACSPMLLVLEPDGEVAGSDEDNGCRDDACDNSPKTVGGDVDTDETVVAIKLGKLKNVDGGGSGGEGSSGGDRNLDRRRCFSMGSFEYVMDETSTLQVPIKPTKKRNQVSKPGHRLVMSECDCNSRRGSASISSQKRESFSISKIWLQSKVTGDSSRKAASFRLSYEGSKVKECSSWRTVTELDVAGWSKNGSEFGECGSDLEVGSCNYSVGSQAEKGHSFARRTLMWIAGRQNKVMNHV